MKLRIDEKWKWLAMDSNGGWWFYDSKPTHDNLQWYNSPYCSLNAHAFNTPYHLWKESLYRRVGEEWVRHVELDLKIDDPVMVRYENGEWFPRHFSHYNEKGLICCFLEGTTSFSGSGATEYWTQWKLPEEV